VDNIHKHKTFILSSIHRQGLGMRLDLHTATHTPRSSQFNSCESDRAPTTQSLRHGTGSPFVLLNFNCHMSLVSYSRDVRVQRYGRSNMCKFMVVFRMQNFNTSGYAPRVIKLGGWRNDCTGIAMPVEQSVYHNNMWTPTKMDSYLKPNL
jgi:hypothetical protein